MKIYKVFLDGREIGTLHADLDLSETNRIGARYGAVLRGTTYTIRPRSTETVKETIYRFETVKTS